jgi:hypothetical protein
MYMHMYMLYMHMYMLCACTVRPTSLTRIIHFILSVLTVGLTV